MYIHQNYNSLNMRGSNNNRNNDRNFWQRIKQKALDVLPEATFKDDAEKIKYLNRLNGHITHPAINRLIMGATALCLQPFIDRHNKKIDEETREVSRVRTIAKIIAGTTVGMIVRGSCYELVKKMTNPHGVKKIHKFLLPIKESNLEALTKDSASLSNYRNALSTCVAIIVMCATNFLIDAPLTVFLTNYLNEKRLNKMNVGGENETAS